MTRPRSSPHMGAEELDRVRRELAALGEAPIEADELALLDGGPTEDVAFVGGLVHLAATSDGPSTLSKFSRRRIWRRVEARTGRRGEGRWAFRSILAAVAAAAAVIVVPQLGPSRESASQLDPAAVEAMGAQARRAMGADEGSASQRAQRMADAYAERMSGARGGR